MEYGDKDYLDRTLNPFLVNKNKHMNGCDKHVTIALLEHYPYTMTVLLEYIVILCQFSKPECFPEICEIP